MNSPAPPHTPGDPLTDRQLLEQVNDRLATALFGIAEMRQLFETYRPLLTRAQAWADQGGAWRSWRNGARTP